MKKTAVITGAAGGIGTALSWTFAQLGYSLALGWAHDEKAALTLAAELNSEYGVTARAYKIDLASPLDLADTYACIRAENPCPDLLVNNGGSEYIGLYQDMTAAELVHIMNCDLIGAMELSRLAAADMAARHSGVMINISSVWGEVGASCETAYSAAKAGLIGFTRALGKELAPCGIRVNCISPGFIDTRMNRQLTPEERRSLIADIPADRAGTAQDVANAAAFLASDKATYICGQVLRVDGAWI